MVSYETMFKFIIINIHKEQSKLIYFLFLFTKAVIRQVMTLSGHALVVMMTLKQLNSTAKNLITSLIAKPGKYFRQPHKVAELYVAQDQLEGVDAGSGLIGQCSSGWLVMEELYNSSSPSNI